MVGYRFFEGRDDKADIALIMIAGTDGIVRHAMLKHSRRVSQPRCAAMELQDLEPDAKGPTQVQTHGGGPAVGVYSVCQVPTLTPPTTSVCVCTGWSR